MVKIKIITGSVRPTRFNTQPAEWIYGLATKRQDMEVELLDLAVINLPFLDEPKSAKSREYTKEHTQKWSKTIDEADGFIFVTPEYNHSLSPVLKNAIDFLYYEWNYKPAAFISYGSLAGGARSVEHLRGVCGEIKIYDLRDQIMFPDYWDFIDANGHYKFNEKHTELANNMLNDIAFWAAGMKGLRGKIPN